MTAPNTDPSSATTRTYRGRPMTTDDLVRIQTIVRDTERYQSRTTIFEAVCEALSWTRADNQPNIPACSAALRRMEKEGLILLPPTPARARAMTGPRRLPTPPRRDWPEAIACPIEELGTIHLTRIPGTGPDYDLYRDLLARFHYLGYHPIRGAQIRYRIDSPKGLLGVIAFGSAAWHVTVRDRFIGWDEKARKQNLPLVVQNVRFLLLPWVRVPNLASHVLALAAHTLPNDWHDRYAVHPLLLETFVDSYQFSGTSYRAANWTYLGQTVGQGRNNHRTRLRRHLPEKDVYIYPLDPGWRARLRSLPTL